jgi:hypothetical protein
MEEGEKLSKKQMEMEQSQRGLRAKLADMEAERDKVAGRLAQEEASGEGLSRAKAKLERDLAAAAEHHKAEVEAQKEQYEQLLAKARGEQVGALGCVCACCPLALEGEEEAGEAWE